MYSPGAAPPQPRPASRGLVIGLRVLFSVLPVVTIGVCAWGSMLRLALMLRRPLDWALVILVGVFGIGGFVMVGVSNGDNSWQSNVGMTFLLLSAFGTPTYFLVMDIRSPRAAQRPEWAVAPAHPNPYAQLPMPGTAPGPIPGAPGIPGRPAYAYGQQQPGAPVPPAGMRIHQVRAELDELSDYLRKGEGR